jgi:hypothetical protein
MIRMTYVPGEGVYHIWPDGSFYVVNDGGQFDPLRKPAKRKRPPTKKRKRKN